MQVMVEGIGLIAPGMPGWAAAQPVLRGERPLDADTQPAFRPGLLPPNERRRATPLIRLALQTAEDALAGSPYPMAELASVFVSSEGDAEIVDRICRALCLPERPVSPTHFHNSVHNAPAGYWAIASGSRRLSTSLAAGPDSFAAALLEATGVAVLERLPVLLLAYDYPLPPPLAGRGYVDAVFGAGLVLSPAEAKKGGTRLRLTVSGGTVGEPPLPDSLRQLRTCNPAAAALPLLAALARCESTVVALPYHGSLTVRIEVEA